MRAAFEQYPQEIAPHHRRAGGRKYELHSAAAGISCQACARPVRRIWRPLIIETK
ncbi:hypothetical protein LNQ03_11565 [Klebsiella pneumoniae subsp. pneumoniae]|nr:hypothetical protein [Klebsiella pneumoniae subsp. pneumoniae]